MTSESRRKSKPDSIAESATENESAIARCKVICEALLFAADKPVTPTQLRQVFEPDGDIGPKEIERAIESLRADCAAESRALMLVEVSGGYAFRTKPEYREWVTRLTAPKAQRLSRAQLETLAIVAYRQPVTRAGVDDIRGVDSGAVLKVLLEKKVLKILGKQEAVGNPLIYGTTREFLEIFGLRDLAALPTLKEFQELDDDSRRALDAHGIVLDEPPSQAAQDASEGFERTGQIVPLGGDDAETASAESGEEE